MSGWQMYCGRCNMLCYDGNGIWKHYWGQNGNLGEYVDHAPMEGKRIPPVFGSCPANVEFHQPLEGKGERNVN